ncbi:MAG TPA: IclR family transcriptional regulator [Steroidobacteraceae bacterium]|nr:IclR family transcriptional regulator [Steroidobacteraceae bacterium]
MLQMDETAGAAATVKSADRVLDLFELLGRWDREMSHTEIAAALGIPKSSLTLLLRNVVGRGYVDFSSVTKGYRLGEAFSRLARQSDRQFDLVACAQPILARITQAVGESSALNRMKGHMAEVVATVLSPHRLLSHMRLGDLAPLYATSGGKALLAHLPEDMIKEYLGTVRFEKITTKTLKSVATLRRELETIRRTGLAYSFEEFTPGIVGVGTVLLPRTGHPIGSLNIAVPAVRSTPELLERSGQVLQRGARELVEQVTQAGADVPE